MAETMGQVEVLPDPPAGLRMLHGKKISWEEGIAIIDACCAEHNYDCGIWQWQCQRLLGTRCEQNGKHGGWAWWKYANAYKVPAPRYQPDEVKYAGTLPILYRRPVIQMIRERSMV